MLEIRKPTQKPVVVIRAASGHELSTYEKRKLANLDPNAQENKIEVIKVNGQAQPIDIENKEVNIDLGKIAFADEIKPDDISDDLFLIKCEIIDADLQKEAN